MSNWVKDMRCVVHIFYNGNTEKIFIKEDFIKNGVSS